MPNFTSATTACNLGCEYCYERAERQVTPEEARTEYDLDLLIDGLHKYSYQNLDIGGVHGGEPFMMGKSDVETLINVIKETQPGLPILQTNGTLINEHDIEMLAKHNVKVGVSYDGPGELNTLRKAKRGGEVVTGNMSEKTRKNIIRLAETDGVQVGLIIVLTKQNAGNDERLEALLDWMDYLTQHHVTGHFNPAVPYENAENDVSLSPERLKDVYLKVYEWNREEEYRKWDPFQSMKNALVGYKVGGCVNDKCDVFNTRSGKHLMGDGESTGCGKGWSTVGDGTRFLQGASADNERDVHDERYQVLKQKPGPQTEAVKRGEIEDQGGCKGCEYWAVCTGGCPAAGGDYDFRNRSRVCNAMYAVYDRIEKDLKNAVPAIRLITETDWDIETNSQVRSGNLNIDPFGHVVSNEKNTDAIEHKDSRLPPIKHQVDEILSEMDTLDGSLFEKYRSQLIGKIGLSSSDIDVDWKSKTITVEHDQRGDVIYE